MNGRSSSPESFTQSSSILDDLSAFLARFVAYPSSHALNAHTLWVVHTHLMDKWESTPRLAFLSPEPGSGKTRALELTETLVPRPLQSINTTVAALFRNISDPDGSPTILFDEIDTIFGPRAKEHEDLRALINAGHRRGAIIHRCVLKGKTIETVKFPAYCAIALAGLGQLPDTILTRSIVIRMRRRAPHEQVEPYRLRTHEPEGHRLRDRLQDWAEQIRPLLLTSPSMPDGVSDRNADVWEPLLAVADAIGGSWPAQARVSAVTLVTDTKRDNGSLGIRLLTDIRTVFGVRDAFSTVDLIEALIDLEESPWGDLKGKPLDGRRLSRLLKPYEVGPKPLRIGTTICKGYERSDFLDPWARYLPPLEDPSISLLVPSPIASVTTVTNGTGDQRELGSDEEWSA
ncbi:MAG: DUF3631 domain-containing protein [Nitrospira sp.]|nr:MAG: DUF3631 domain-containing protein [Nitrospira sp.]